MVLKPTTSDREVAWIAAFVDALQVEGRLRVARFVPADGGEFVGDGWAATQWLDGRHRQDRWDETLAATRTLHEAARVVGPEWPAFMQERIDAWSRATRAAWGEEPLPALPAAAAEMVDAAARLLSNRAGGRAQVVHSDLAGNVLFADDSDLPPAIIDISPQFRTASYAEAILVADAVAWGGADLTFAERFLGTSASRRADLARAVSFRVATAALFPNATAAHVDAEARGYRSLMGLLV